MHHNVNSHIGITADEFSWSANQNIIFSCASFASYTTYSQNIWLSLSPFFRSSTLWLFRLQTEKWRPDESWSVCLCAFSKWLCVFSFCRCIFISSVCIFWLSLRSRCQCGHVKRRNVRCIFKRFVSVAPLGWFERYRIQQSVNRNFTFFSFLSLPFCVISNNIITANSPHSMPCTIYIKRQRIAHFVNSGKKKQQLIVVIMFYTEPIGFVNARDVTFYSVRPSAMHFLGFAVDSIT